MTPRLSIVPRRRGFACAKDLVTRLWFPHRKTPQLTISSLECDKEKSSKRQQ